MATAPRGRRGGRLSAALLPLILASCAPAVTPAAYPTENAPSGESILSTRSAAPTGPFEGTPAETYAKGSDGISLPAAKAVTGFTGEQARVSGRVTYASVKENGLRSLRVTTNFVWVYAFVGEDHPIAAVHDEVQWDFAVPGQVRPADRGLWIRSARSYTAWMDCDAAAKGLLAPGKRTSAPAPQPSGTEDADNYLRADHTMDVTGEC
jgi:hypothetical protein